MTGKQLEFDQRVNQLNKKHEKLSRGYRASVRSDGLVEMKPVRFRSAISMKFVVLSLCGFFAFKAFLLSTLGASGYESRVNSLNEGTPVEQAGAWVMQIDPLSELVASQLNKVLY